MAGYRGFLEDYERVLRDSGLYADAELASFRGGNAIDFLGLGVGGSNRRRLGLFYQSNQIPTPKWFETAVPAAVAPAEEGDARV